MRAAGIEHRSGLVNHKPWEPSLLIKGEGSTGHDTLVYVDSGPNGVNGGGTYGKIGLELERPSWSQGETLGAR
jgi:hypothetical protein